MYLFKTLINCTIFIIHIKYIKNKILKKITKLSVHMVIENFIFFIKKKN